MTMKNKYVRRSRISEAKIREIVRYVAADLTALQAAALSGLNRNTVNRLYRGVRERMRLACEAQRRLFGVVEVDESFFGARRVKGRRGARRLRQDRRLRHLRTAGLRLYRDRPGLARSPRSRASSAAGSTRALSSTPMGGAATTAWSISATVISALTIPRMNSCGAPSISTASRGSGAWQKSGSLSSRACRNTPSICILRRPNGDTTIATTTNTDACYSTYARTRSARHDPRINPHRRDRVRRAGPVTDCPGRGRACGRLSNSLLVR